MNNSLMFGRPTARRSHDDMMRTSFTPGRLVASLILPFATWPVLSGCLPTRPPPEGPILWAVGPSERVRADEAPREQTACFSQERNTIRLEGAVNETVAFEFVLSSRSDPLTGIRLEAEDFIGPLGSISGEAVKMYRHWPVTIERYPSWFLRTIGLAAPRQFPDALVPIDAPAQGQPFTLLAGVNLPVWTEARIPKGTRPGLYTGAINVRDSLLRQFRLPIELVVHDIFLDPDNAIPVLAGVRLSPLVAAHTSLDPTNNELALRDPEARKVLNQAFGLLHEHDLSPYTVDIRPRLNQKVDGAVIVDWSGFDEVCGPWIDGSAFADGRRAAAWPLPVDQEQPAPTQFDGGGSPFYAAVLKSYLAQCRDHFSGKGWLDRAYIDFCRGAGEEDRQEQARLLGIIAPPARAIDHGLRILSTLIPQPMTPFGWLDYRQEHLDEDVDIWATPARYQDAETLRRLRGQGKISWLPPGHPPFAGSLAVEAQPIDARSLPWQAFLQGHAVVWIEQATDFPPSVFDGPVKDPAQPSDTWLLYPGRPFGLRGPIPSVRLKQLQLGIQDAGYLHVLTEHGRGETARLIAGSLLKAAGTDAFGDNYLDGLFARRTTDPGIWELAHRLLVEETALTLRPDSPVPVNLAANRLAWAEFLAATRRIELLPESAVLAVVDERRESPVSGASRSQRVFRSQFHVAVRNDLRTPIQGTLEFSAPPPDARIIADRSSLGPIGESRLARAQLGWELEHLPPLDLDGHYPQRIAFDAKTYGRVEREAMLSAVVAPVVPRPIVVDGDLGDWPPSESNIAGDLRLINDHADPATRRGRAASQTIAYVCQHDGVLYIGLHAAAPAGRESAGPTRASSEVRYEDLQPVGEDLVEVLLDPTRVAVRSDELYHIVIKSSGIASFARGVRTEPPIGRFGPWPTPAPTHAVARTDFGWSAEIAIPLRALGAAPHATVWGFNIARLEPSRGEYSDWARAPRYCYDPRTLGNLIWPD